MRKKNQPNSPPIIPESLLELAKKSVETDKPVRADRRCAICGTGYTPMSGPQQTEDLCWVCRRLKISAWRDTDQQVSAQE